MPYLEQIVNLNPLTGGTSTLRFTGVEDASVQTSFVLDDTTIALTCRRH